jgi:hypothetical protein
MRAAGLPDVTVLSQSQFQKLSKTPYSRLKSMAQQLQQEAYGDPSERRALHPDALVLFPVLLAAALQLAHATLAVIRITAAELPTTASGAGQGHRSSDLSCPVCLSVMHAA